MMAGSHAPPAPRKSGEKQAGFPQMLWNFNEAARILGAELRRVNFYCFLPGIIVIGQVASVQAPQLGVHSTPKEQAAPQDAPRDAEKERAPAPSPERRSPAAERPSIPADTAIVAARVIEDLQAQKAVAAKGWIMQLESRMRMVAMAESDPKAASRTMDNLARQIAAATRQYAERVSAAASLDIQV
jgi:hypothetical protein